MHPLFVKKSLLFIHFLVSVARLELQKGTEAFRLVGRWLSRGREGSMGNGLPLRHSREDVFQKRREERGLKLQGGWHRMDSDRFQTGLVAARAC